MTIKRDASGRFISGSRFWLGKKRSKDTRKKMSDGMKNRVPWNKGKKCPQLSVALKGRQSPMKGKSHSKKTREKISNAMLGHPNWGGFQKGHIYYGDRTTLFKSGHKSWCKGTKGIVKPNNGSFKKGDQRISSENNHNWKGGITPETSLIRHSPEYREWRKAVFKRDNYTCQFCGSDRGGNFVAHHIEPFADFPESRFDLNNGITLCQSCHELLHYKFRISL